MRTIKNKQLQSLLESQSVSVAVVDGTSLPDTSGNSKVQDTIEINADIFSYKQAIDELFKRKPMNDINDGVSRDLIASIRENFCGGLWSDLLKSLDVGVSDLRMTKLNKVKESISTGACFEELRTAMSMRKPVRCRTFSEYDGDYDFDRRFEITQFQSQKKVMTGIKALDLIANFSVTCGADSNLIDNFGATIWALTQLIEESGIQVRLTVRNETKSVDDSRTVGVRSNIVVKDFGSYLSPSITAAVLTSNYYRRMSFIGLVMSADLFGLNVSDGLGYPVKKESVKASHGVLELSAHTFQGLNLGHFKSIMEAVS